MKVVILSDTHMPKRAKTLPPELIKGLKQADLILHAGDWQTLDIFEALQQFAPVEGVAGNVDDEAIIQRFGRKKIIEAGDMIIGIVHGDGKGKTTPKRAWDAFKSEQVDLIVFGHSHIPFHQEYNDTILFNPGSPTDKRRQKEFSYGLLDTDSPTSLKHVFYQDKR